MRYYSRIFTYPHDKPAKKGYYIMSPQLESITKFHNTPNLDVDASRIGQEDIPPYPWYFWNGEEWMSDHLPDAIDVGWPQSFWFGVSK